jgi:hypothetical protein
MASISSDTTLAAIRVAGQLAGQREYGRSDFRWLRVTIDKATHREVIDAAGS